MTPETVLEQFGYLAVFIGTFLEGEGILVAAGFFASREHLDLLTVWLVAFTAAYTGHVFWFWLGRAHGVRLLDRFPRMKRHTGQGLRVFERYGVAAILMTQWLYGLRITCAVVIGMSRIAIVRFLLYQALSSLIWVTTFVAGGFYFGRAIETLLGRIDHLEKYVVLAIVLLAVAFWLYHRKKDRETDVS